MWKDFLYFTKGERRGTIVLLALLAALAIFRIALPHLLKTEEQGTELTQKEVEKLKDLEQRISKLTENRPLKGKIDPLQLDSSGFVKVGFTAQEAHELVEKKRRLNREEFYFQFMDFAIRKNPEWVDHIADFSMRAE